MVAVLPQRSQSTSSGGDCRFHFRCSETRFAPRPQKQLMRLQRVQNAAARLICRVKKKDHITPALMSLHWLPVRLRPNFKILTLVYRLLKDIGPLYLRELISRYQPSRSLRSQSKNLLMVPCSRTVSYGSRAFPVAAANLWNNLPENIREAGDLATFKRLLKTEYYRKAYGE